MKFEVLKHTQAQLKQHKNLIPSSKQNYSTSHSPAREDIQSTISAVYNSEFDEEFTSILITAQDDFLKSVSSFAMQKMKEVFPASEFSHKSMSKLIEKEEARIIATYLCRYKLLSAALNDYETNKSTLMKFSKHLSSKNNDRFSFLKQFRKHCPLTEPIARHSCDGAASKFLEVTEESSTGKEELLTHIICINCKQCFPIESMLLYCSHCKCDYYSSLLSPNEKVDILPATWKKYHCGSMVNEMMKCIQCREVLYLNCKSLLLMCLNKKCNFVSDPHSIVWKCALCKKDFNAEAKIYNPMEFNVMKKAIRNALLIKQKAFPSQLKCCSKVEQTSLTFYHKKECSGVLYKGVFNKAEIVVCSKCNAINYYEKFIWTCPLCDKRFKCQAGFERKDEDNSAKNAGRRLYSAYEKKKPIEVNDMSNSEENAYLRKTEPKKRKSLKEYLNDKRADSKDKEADGKAQQKHRRGATKSGDFRFTSIYSSDIREELENIPKKVCVNLLENFNIAYEENENPLFLELECLKNQKDKKKDSTQVLIDNLTPIKVKSEIKEQRKENPKPSKEKEITNDSKSLRKANKDADEAEKARESINKIKVTNSGMKKTLEESLESISKASTIPLFNIETLSVIKSIGEGSYGIIYLIERPDTKARFALKKIITHNLTEAKTVQKEFELMYSNQHDNIMKIFSIQFKLLDFSTYSIYVLMELAESDWFFEIKTRTTHYRYYKETELIHIIKQLTQALAFLQRKKISHRDIKPQNILLYKHSVAKMADFGEAKEIKKAKQVCTLRGTELYMSPILYEGLKNNQEDVVHNAYKSDVFSLGYCVLYASSLNPNIINQMREVTDMNLFKERIDKELKRYSPKFRCLLYQMLEIDEQKRIDFIELEKQLEGYYS